jgi:hypothetical protein
MPIEQQTILPAHLQTRIWNGWLSAEIRGCYFAELVSVYKGRQKKLTWAILLFSSGASITIASHWSVEWPKLVLALITTALSLFSLVERFEDRALKCSDLHLDWNRIANGYRDIWENMYAEDAEEKLRDLSEQELSASKAGLEVPDDDDRLVKCQEYVESQHGAT